MDFPTPGGPIISRLWNPAAAIIAPLLALSCPDTSLKSPLLSAFFFCNSSSARILGLYIFSFSASGCSRAIISSPSSPTPHTVIPGITAASNAFSRGTITLPIPLSAASRTIGSTPLTLLISPFSPSSPKNSVSRTASSVRSSISFNKPTAIGRSNAVPSLRLPAGARFTVIWQGGI